MQFACTSIEHLVAVDDSTACAAMLQHGHEAHWASVAADVRCSMLLRNIAPEYCVWFARTACLNCVQNREPFNIAAASAPCWSSELNTVRIYRGTQLCRAYRLKAYSSNATTSLTSLWSCTGRHCRSGCGSSWNRHSLPSRRPCSGQPPAWPLTPSGHGSRKQLGSGRLQQRRRPRRLRTPRCRSCCRCAHSSSPRSSSPLSVIAVFTS